MAFLSKKQDIRQRICQKRLSLSQKDLEDYAIKGCQKAYPIISGLKPHYVASYKYFQKEWNPYLLERCLKKQGIKILYPKMGTGKHLTFHHTEDFAYNRYGILEPVAGSPVEIPDLLLCPLVALDRNKRRLGYGGGYYDRFCALYPHLPTVAVVYDFQWVKDFQAEAHDLIFDHWVVI